MDSKGVCLFVFDLGKAMTAPLSIRSSFGHWLSKFFIFFCQILDITKTEISATRSSVGLLEKQ